MGERVPCPDAWQVNIDPVVRLKLETWYEYSRGLELSGYALLTERPTASLDESKTFFIDDILLLCDIGESSGGYTEIQPEDRVKGMMWARELGRSANQLVWWHIHPISGWSGTDVNTCRQRVHEAGLAEVLSTLSIVRTPVGIRARWDQSGPEANIFVDGIPVHVMTPEMAQIAEEAKAEVIELLAQRRDLGPGFRATEADVEADGYERPELPAADVEKEGEGIP
jgi:hypothetical protein